MGNRQWNQDALKNRGRHDRQKVKLGKKRRRAGGYWKKGGKRGIALLVWRSPKERTGKISPPYRIEKAHRI